MLFYQINISFYKYSNLFIKYSILFYLLLEDVKLLGARREVAIEVETTFPDGDTPRLSR